MMAMDSPVQSKRVGDMVLFSEFAKTVTEVSSLFMPQMATQAGSSQESTDPILKSKTTTLRTARDIASYALEKLDLYDGALQIFASLDRPIAACVLKSLGCSYAFVVSDLVDTTAVTCDDMGVSIQLEPYGHVLPSGLFVSTNSVHYKTGSTLERAKLKRVNIKSRT